MKSTKIIALVECAHTKAISHFNFLYTDIEIDLGFKQGQDLTDMVRATMKAWTPSFSLISIIDISEE